MRRSILACLLLAAASSAAGVLADEVPDHLPASTIAYVRFGGLQDVPDTLEKLPVWTGEGWQGEARAKLEELLFGGLADEMEISKERAMPVLRACRTVHAALLSFDPKDEAFEAVFVLEMDDVAAARDLMEKELAEMFQGTRTHGTHTIWMLGDGDRTEAEATLAEGRVVVAVGDGVIGRYLDAEAGDAADRLSGVSTFQEVAGEFGSSAMWGFVNVEAILTSVKTGLDMGDRKEYDRVDSVFVLSDYHAVGFGARWETSPEDLSTRVRIYHEAEMPGLMEFASDPAGAEALRFVPDGSVLAFTTAVADGGATWRRIKEFIVEAEKVLDEGDPTPDFSQGLDEIKREGAIDLDTGFALVKGPAAVFLPVVDGGFDDEYTTFVFQVSDAEAARAWFQKVKTEGEAFKKHAESGQIKTETRGDATIEWIDGERERVGYAIVGNWVVASGDVDALRAALDAKAGKIPSIVTRYGDVMEKFPAGHQKTLFLDPSWMLGQERETGLAAYRIRKDWPLLLGMTQHESHTDLAANASPMGVLAVVGLGAWLDEETDDDRDACRERMERLGQAMMAYRTKHGDSPPSLAELAKDQGLDANAARCPLDDAAPGSEGYTYLRWPKAGLEEAPWYGIVAWCPHGEHGRVGLSAQGPEGLYATTFDESRFMEYLGRTRRWLAESEAKDGEDR